jgi:hypothetical protein
MHRINPVGWHKTRPDPRLVIALQERAIQIMPTFTRQGLSDVMWAIARLPLSPEEGLLKVHPHALHKIPCALAQCYLRIIHLDKHTREALFW